MQNKNKNYNFNIFCLFNSNFNCCINEYKKELSFKTKVNDIRRISIKQKINENMIIKGIEVPTKYLRKIEYDIYIISEKSADEKNKGSYNKIYTASISMARQCLSRDNEDCELKDFVNLLNNNKTNLSSLKEIKDLKDFPVALCLVNITDTNIITSILCPESLPENVKNELLSDLHYFRPLVKISSKKTHEMGITTDNNIKNIRKQSKGLCDITSNSPSFCNIDTNITKDSEGNLLSFNEIKFIDITSDINNTLSNNKTTYLFDETSQINDLNPDKYKAILNDLLQKLKPYMKYEEIDTNNNYLKQSNRKILKDRLHNNRHLESNNNMFYKKNFTKEESLLFMELYGKIINLYLTIDSGINVETMKALLNLKLGEKNYEITNIQQFTNLNQILYKLKSLSNKGNYLAYQLLEKLKKYIDDLPQKLSKLISNLNEHIIYKNLTELFNSSFLLNASMIANILNDFGTSYITYNEFKKKLDKIISDNQKNTLEKNSENYENSINIGEFLKISNETFLSIKDNYVNIIRNNITNYYKNFPKDFIIEVNQNNNNIVYNNLDETFETIIKKIDKTKSNIEYLNIFKNYDKIIIKNINNLNLEYKESKKLIEDSDYDEETNNYYNNKLNDLKEITMDYYTKVNESYYNIRQYLNEFFKNIYHDIDKCINATYETLIKEYKKISEEEKSINEEYSNNNEFSLIKNLLDVEDTIYYIDADITYVENYAKFTLDLLFEDNNFRYPKLVASIINKNKPKKMWLDIYSPYGYCSKTGTIIEATFSDTNYIMNLNYGTKTEKINMTTIINYEKYEFIEAYKIADEVITQCHNVMGISLCRNSCNQIKSYSEKKFNYDKKELISKSFIEF